MNIFEQASRERLRFNVGSRRNLATEDLWSLPLTGNNGENLDQLAITLNAAKEESTPKSFVGEVENTQANKLASLKFDIVKHIIDVKLEELDATKNAMAKAVQIRELQALRARKEAEALGELSIEEIDAKLKELGYNA